MKKLLVYMRGYVIESVLGPLFKFLEAGFELLVPLVVAAMIDRGVGMGDRPYLLKMTLILVGLCVVGVVCALTAQYFAAKAATGFAKKVRRALFAHIQTLSYADLDTLGTATLMTRITSDINQVQTGVNLTLRLLLRSPFVVFGAMAMAFTIDWKAALVFLVMIPLLAAAVFFVMFVCIPIYRKVQKKLDGVVRLTKETLSGARVIRAFGSEDKETERFTGETMALVNTQLRASRIAALMNPMTYAILNLSIVALVWIGAIRVESGVLTQGAVVALYNYMSQILVELIKLAHLLMNINKAVACGNRISDILAVQPSLCGPSALATAADSHTAVAFRNVSMRYPGMSGDSIQDVSFAAQRGETIGIIGATGSGKSTLVNLIPRFYDASEGEVLVNGLPVAQYPLDVLRHKIGIVPQQTLLFHGSIRENMLWGKENATDEEIMEALELAQAKNIVLEREGELAYIIEQGGKNLSGGQRQRLTIARALLRKPEILILDDSVSALDYATDAALRTAIRGIRGMTVFMVSQRISSIQYADRILVLEDGHLAGSGTSDQLLQSCPVYQEIYQTQVQGGGKRHG